LIEASRFKGGSLSVQHAVGSANQAQSVLNGIDPQFFNKETDFNDQYYLGRKEVSNQDFLGVVSSYDNGVATILQRNYFKVGDEVEVFGPSTSIQRFTIESIINQTYKNIEIICVDDGSTDGSAEICDGYRVQDSRIKVIHKVNQGPVSARQAGLQVAQGKYVGFVDGDDWIEPEMYQCMFENIEKYNVDMVETGVIDSYGDMSCKERKYKLQEGVYKGENFKNNILDKLMYDGEFYNYGVNTIYIWNKLFKREYISECYMKLDFRQSMFEDFVSVYPYLIKHQSVAVINRAFYHYRVVNNSLKRTKLNNAKEILELHIKTMNEVINNAGQYREELSRQFDYFKMFFLLLNDIKSFDIRSEKNLIPYGGIDCDTSVIIYGAGVNGINIYRYLKENSRCNIVNWVDKMYSIINLEDAGIHYKIKSPESIELDGTDKIIITALNADAATDIKSGLVSRGISYDRIVWIKNEYIANPQLLLKAVL